MPASQSQIVVMSFQKKVRWLQRPTLVLCCYSGSQRPFRAWAGVKLPGCQDLRKFSNDEDFELASMMQP